MEFTEFLVAMVTQWAIFDVVVRNRWSRVGGSWRDVV